MHIRQKSDPSYASDAELQTILTMWGKYDVADIAATIRRKERTVLKWAQHVLHLLPKDNRKSPLRQKVVQMRCQNERCQRLQPLSKQCVACGAPRSGLVAA